ncbi:hypothetical protein QYE76_041659 [Lolium multiflorum]|uniref:Uncharacterized protein n=1 Tax=Lolium multiflorum TaxID=4521 RepID=A0AAD8TE90_LOLMU|nr:hypothetical protein QYE76_041659 [Lolium multiflorum]
MAMLAMSPPRRAPPLFLPPLPWPPCQNAPPHTSTSPSINKIAVDAVASPEIARPERARKPLASRVDTPRTSQDTCRPASTRSPWPLLQLVEHLRATWTPPDMSMTRPWTATTVDGEEDPATAAARHGRNASRTDAARPCQGYLRIRLDAEIVVAPSPSPTARRNRRERVDHHPAPQHPCAAIKGDLPWMLQAHHRTPHLSPLLNHLTTHLIHAGARPIESSPPWKLCSNRRRTSPPQATPPVPGASPSSTSTPSTLPSLAGALMEPNEPINTKFYQLGNGGDLIFERDLNTLSDFLERLHPEFHGIQVNDQPGGELQWIITADLRGKMEPPTSERILFSFRESNWHDRLARALQEALARLCGQNVVRILASRYAHLVRRDAMGMPMELQPHPELRRHAEHLDFMLYHTQQDLDNARAYANQTHLALANHADAIKLLNHDRKKLRIQRAKKDATITRLRAQIAALEATVKAQEEQLQEMEEDEAGIDLQGGGAFLSDDDDFEEDEFTEEEDYAFLEPNPDDVVPIDIEDEGSRT